MPRSRSHHAEWLELVEVSGAFLSLPVLERVFPQGLYALDQDRAAKLRLARAEWAEGIEPSDPDLELHGAWVRYVLTEALEYGPEVLIGPEEVPSGLTAEVTEHAERLSPDFVISAPDREADAIGARLLVRVYPPGQDLDGQVQEAAWATSPLERMSHLCRAAGVRLGLVTNGERWALVDAPVGETSTYISWYASLWSQEPLTLRAFQSLLGARRFFGADQSETLEAMLAESASYQAEVTEQLGAQVRRAVEVLVQALDRADADTGRVLLSEVSEAELYEAALTIMMRLVFMFFAEENDLLPLRDDLYQQHYAASTLRGQLREEADRVGIEVLERRQDAWPRLLATFRAIYAGIEHDALRLPAYGGSLFDPDRFPFLEGRLPETTWLETDARPLPVDNRTTLHLLDALQVLQMKGRRGAEARKLSFRGLDIEQIGHVYEMLLDHQVLRADAPGIGLVGGQGREPEIGLDLLEELQARGGNSLVDYLSEETKKSRSALEKALTKEPDPEWVGRLRGVCGEEEGLFERVLPYHALIRTDPWGEPIVIRKGSVFVTAGAERRSTGTYYTPRALTEEVVTHALEPVTFKGVAEGKPREEWKLRTPAEILDLKVCDLAMGSGAFLVQAVRWLSERLIEAWREAEEIGAVTIEGTPISGASSELVIPADLEERAALARRLVADRCIYGVDINPLAVEMAKLSLWFVTLAKGRPFSFLDHALKCGDSLLGINDLDQIRHFHWDANRGKEVHATLFDPTHQIEPVIQEALQLRRELESFTVRDVRDAEQKSKLNSRADGILNRLRLLGDLVIGAAMTTTGQGKAALDKKLQGLTDRIPAMLEAPGTEVDELLRADAMIMLNEGKPPLQRDRQTMHWPLEFPEVFLRERPGFDALLSNPPYIGNKYWKERLGATFQSYFASVLGHSLGKPDVIVLFLWRMVGLARDEGMTGCLATQSVTEVDSKSLIQADVLDRATMIRAFRARAWPGDASVRVSIIWTWKGVWEGDFVLDAIPVVGIGADLRETLGEEPKALSDPLFAFEGVHNSRGKAFVVPSEHSLCEHRDLFKPYLSGEDLTDRDPTRPVRHVLDLSGWSETDLESLPTDVTLFLNEVVRPTRTKQDLKSYKGLEKRWWTFWNTREAGFRVVRERDYCIALPSVAKYLLPVRLPSQWVYTNKVVLFDLNRSDTHTILLSLCFDIWASKYGGSLGPTRVMKIAPVIRTFPLPSALADGSVSDAWQEAALGALSDFGPGLTDVLNLVNDSSCDAKRVKLLRALHQDILETVLESYGWRDLDVDLSFQPTEEGVRWSAPIDVRSELLRRLHSLNQERHGRSEEAGQLSFTARG